MKNNVYLLKTSAYDIPIEMQYGFRKRLTLTVYPDKRVVARIPYGFPGKKAEAYFHKKIRWMIKHLDHFEQHPPEHEKTYVEGEKYEFLGQDYILRLKQGPNQVTIAENELILQVKDPEDRETKKKVLDNWYRKKAIATLSPLFEAWMKKLHCLKLPKANLRFYKMKRRWGSCSGKGVITLNTELVRKDPKLIDYVIVHEICHLKIPAHNKEFYALVESVMPDWKERRAALNDHTLM